MNENSTPADDSGPKFPGGLQAVWLGGALVAGIALIAAISIIESSQRAKLEAAVKITPTAEAADGN